MSAVDASGDSVSVSKSGDTFSFVMPSKSVSFSVTLNHSKVTAIMGSAGTLTFDLLYSYQVPSVGSSYDGETVLGVWDDVETRTSGAPGWHAFNSIIVTATSKVDTIVPLTCEYWFDECANIGDCADVMSHVDMSQCRSMKHMFYNSPGSEVDLGMITSWDVSNVEDMNGAFYNAIYGANMTSFQTPAGWDVSKVKDMSWMFAENHKITRLTIRNNFCDNVEYASGMFSNLDKCTNLTVPATSFANIRDASYMYEGGLMVAYTLPVSFASNGLLTNTHGMFRNCPRATAVTFQAAYDSSHVTDIGEMFSNMTSLKNIRVYGSFSIASVTNLDEDVFIGSTKLTNYDASRVSGRYARLSSEYSYGYLTYVGS